MSWYPFGNLPNGVALPVPADIYQDDGPVIRGYWDLSWVSQGCLIRRADPAGGPCDREIEIEEQLRRTGGIGRRAF